jgi:Holin of 3TMs, for gene-transfer release
MANIGTILGSIVGGAASPETGIVSAAEGIIGMFKLDPTKKAEMLQQLQLANLDLEKTELAGTIAQMQGQLATNEAEANTKNTFIAGWRPFVGWTCGAAFGWAFVLQPFVAFIAAALGHPLTLPTLDLSTMMPVLLGMLGLGGLRTYEKVQGVPGVNQKDS